MGWTILIIFVCLVAISWASVESESQKEKIKKKREEEERAKSYREIEERDRKYREERERKHREALEKGPELFEAELNAIEKASITLSEEKMPNLLVTELDYNIYKIRSDTILYSCGNYTVVDVETTGLKVSCEIIEISAIRVRNFKPVKAYTTLIKPKKEIPFDITDLTGITNDMVANAPNIKQIMPGFIDFVGKDNLLGHNLLFDLKFLYKNGFDFTKNRRRYYDTLDMAKSKVRKMPPSGAHDDGHWEVIDYKLDSLCENFDIYRNSAHRSLSDCLATSKLFYCLLKRYDID